MPDEDVYAVALRGVLQKEFRENLRSLMREEFQGMMKEFAESQQLPPLLTRKEMMEVLRISHDKAAQLMARPDFPVSRVAGVLIDRDKLFEWIDRHTQWVEENTRYHRVV